MDKDVIVALDFKNIEETKSFVEKFTEPLYFKVGMELFYAEGINIIKYIKDKGHKIFLDLKLHDIPNTVKSSMKILANLNVDMVNVHCSGGLEMMKAAIEGLNEGSRNKKRPLCIAVTQLTSTSEKVMQEQLLIEKSLQDVVLSYAKMAKKANLDGVVCSALESNIIHNLIGTDFITCTPGIRLLNDDKNDQSRVVTPDKARELTSDYIVVGRSITKSKNPVATYNLIKNLFIKI